MTDKTIIPFATSGGSGMGKTNEVLKPSCPTAVLMEGKVFKPDATKKELADWVASYCSRIALCYKMETLDVINE